MFVDHLKLHLYENDALDDIVRRWSWRDDGGELKMNGCSFCSKEQSACHCPTIHNSKVPWFEAELLTKRAIAAPKMDFTFMRTMTSTPQ